MQENNDTAEVFCTATGDTQTLVDFYLGRGQMSDAVLSAQVACEGLVPSDNQQQGTKQSNGWPEPSELQIKYEVL